MLAWRRTALSRRVSVSLKTGKAIDGVLVTARGPLLVVKNARLLEAGRAPQPLDGDVVIERTNVDFTQVLATPPAPTEGA
jgi:small nuclear ribonucleoprotein (snRNP)-like protein